MRRQNNNNKQKRGGGNKRNSPMGPPQISSNVVLTRTWRFRSTSASATTVEADDLCSVAGVLCSTANVVGYTVARSVRVHRVSIWAPPASQGAASTCSVEWTDATYLPMKEDSDSTVSVARPAHIRAKPPVGSAASFWQQAAAQTLMTITAPVGSIIDVHCSHVLFDSGAAGNSYAFAAGTVGVLYYMPLDGPSDVFLPVSLVTTT